MAFIEPIHRNKPNITYLLHNYSKEFQSIKVQKEKQKINFQTNKNLRYNKKFTMRDLKRSLKSPIIHH